MFAHDYYASGGPAGGQTFEMFDKQVLTSIPPPSLTALQGQGDVEAATWDPGDHLLAAGVIPAKAYSS
ncbi:hypothetical protein DSLASN_25280 [Desulfoluna limicola]|uniref:Uncharacterized protein n=1 Tax=Desulfoluna limicola TaxID=2810562 RepID=A0ABN6F4L6_9BACT|nr:hypothetical protein DSLASN_25280 [Desulfoluna limicola]